MRGVFIDQFESNSNIFSYADWLKDVKIFNSDINFSDYQKNIFIEESSKDFRYPNSLESLKDSPLENVLIGRHTYKLPNGMTSPNVVLGRYCSISAYVLLGLTHHNYNLLSTSPSLSFNNNEPLNYTVIGCDVWIGANAIILNGAKIGHGSVIGAGSVVKKMFLHIQL